MADNNFRELELMVMELKADVAILKTRFDMVREQSSKLEGSLESESKDFVDMKLELSTKFSHVENDLNNLASTVQRLSTTLKELSARIEALANNTFLNFFSEFNIRKLVALIALIVSLVSSPTLITNYISKPADTSSEKLDELIKLLSEP